MGVVFIYGCECGRYFARDLSDDPNKPCECGSTSYVLKSTVDAKLVLERIANELSDAFEGLGYAARDGGGGR